MASVPVTAERFEMGQVMSRTLGIIGRNALMFGGLIIVLQVLPELAIDATTPSLAGAPAATGTHLPAFGNRSPFAIVGSLLALIMQAAVTYVALVDLDGGRPQTQPMSTVAGRCMLPLLGVGILTGLGIGLGFVLLIVPGMILATMWSVAGVVVVAERNGVFASMTRSRELTKGYRWPIFGLLVILGLMLIAFVLVLGFGTGLFSQAAAVTTVAPGIAVQILTALVEAGLKLLFTVTLTAIYVELRAIKEGASGAMLADIFA